MDSTISFEDTTDEAFAAFLQAQENGQQDAARQLLRDHPGLADQVAMYFALCARVPQPWESSVNSYAGRTIGDFELLHELDRGAEGEVYKARQKSLGQRYVAVKVMRRERFSQEREKQQFRRDGALLASLQHPNIVQIYFAGESETGVPYFAMELMQESLKQKLANGWLPTPTQAAELTHDLAKAVQCAHVQGIIHRDLKPGNILLDANDIPKIVDFGLGKRLDAGTTMTQPGIKGTPSYMSPEAAAKQPAGLPCDIYGLGAVLYELLTGRPPFVGKDLLDTLEQVQHHEPIPVRLISPAAPRDLEAICLKCLEKDPARRYLSAEELAADLQRFIRGEPVHIRRPGMAGRAVRALLRHQFANVTAWGWPCLLAGIITAVNGLLAQWVISSEQPVWVWASFGALGAFMFVFPFWYTLRHRQFGVGDRQVLAIKMAPLAAMCLLPVVYRPSEGMNLTAYRLSLYPIFALIVAMSHLFGGALFWGGFYLSALAYVLLAVLMQFIPESSSLLFYIYTALIEILLGWYLLKLRKSAAFRN